MVKIVSLSKTREKNENSFLANFSVSGELVPLKVSEVDRPTVYSAIQVLIKNSGSDVNSDLGVDLFNLMSPEASAKKQIQDSIELSGNVKIVNGHIYFGEYLLEETLQDHMLSLLDDNNTPKDESVWKSYVLFLDNLHQNVSEDIRKQLFRWMEYESKAGNDFGITDDGCIVGYKGCEGTILEPTSVNSGSAIVDGVEMTGRIPNKVGSVIRMPRSNVEFDPQVGCAAGLHVGTRDYATKWAPILTLVKVNPRDVVSVPYESESQKMRVCEYTVLEVIDTNQEHKRFYNSNGETKSVSSTRIPQEDYELSREDCYELLHEDITVVYEDNKKEFTGTVVDIFESHRGDNDGVILTDEDGNYKHIKLYRINKWEVTECSEPEKEEKEEIYDNQIFTGTTIADLIARELDGLLKSIQNDFDKEDDELLSKIKKIKEGDYIEVSYDNNEKSFEGVVSSIYKDYDGIIIRSEFGDVKHIKVHRITEVVISDKLDGHSDDEYCEGLDELFCYEEEVEDTKEVEVPSYINVGEHVVVHSLIDGKLSIQVGVVLKVLGDVLRVGTDVGYKDLNIKDVLSITTL